MGPEDWKVLSDLRQTEPEFFSGTCIDAGSRNMNGSVKFFLNPEVDFIGIDEFEIGEGRCITWQGLVHDYPGEAVADMVTCFNSFEHDYYWKKTVQKLIELLKPNGLFIFQLICSGVEHGNVNPTEPYGKDMGDGTRYYKNVDPKEFQRHVETFPTRILKKIEALPGEKVECFVDRFNRGVEEPIVSVLSRYYVYLIGRKN